MNENIINEVTEVETETAEALVEAGSSHTGLKVAGIITLIGGLAFAGYKGAKVLIAKRKAKKETEVGEVTEVSEDEITPVEEE